MIAKRSKNVVPLLDHRWSTTCVIKGHQNDGSNETLKHLNETVDSTLDDDVETDKPPKQKDVTLLRARHRTIRSSKQPTYKCVKHYGREKGRCVKVRCKSMAK